ncbi:MAG: hypothetical protein A2Z40_01665 [Deltaproteobacteria bacterium RBG_19FT_COMBO_60_16]|nr:MAG: hypothetical protein A2Z13_04055 [Deltaproteobacteria bacterium RBG_16_64_85]OGQ01237.1 MAG: hypothetical protein A2Z40_01665 [Deltaproteobacteria bacterium RBG_19FT_COMBO_60_16]
MSRNRIAESIRLKHATVGRIDISARVYTRKALGKDLISFTVPYAMFLEMEENVEGSFMTRTKWRKPMSFP